MNPGLLRLKPEERKKEKTDAPSTNSLAEGRVIRMIHHCVTRQIRSSREFDCRTEKMYNMN